MAGKDKDFLKMVVTEKFREADRDLPAAEAVQRSRAQADALSTAIAGFNRAVTVKNGGSGLEMSMPAGFAGVLNSDYAGVKEAEIDVEFWNSDKTFAMKQEYGTVDVNPQDIDRLIASVQHATQEMLTLRGKLGDMTHFTHDQLVDASVQLELKGRQTLASGLQSFGIHHSF